nr:hypothetical protein [Phytoactinopolyspora endophytica]
MSTRAGKAGALSGFYEFAIARYEGTIRRATGVLVEQPIDEFNRQSGASLGKVRVPPSDEEIDSLFTAWRGSVTQARKYRPAARDYFAASLWRRLGLRINETVMLDIRDWRSDLGEFGKLHVRHGKGSRGGNPGRRVVAGVVGTDDATRAAALLRLVAVRGRHGHQGAPRAAWPPVAGDDLGLPPRPQ